MNINVLLKTVQNLGDHGREVSIALNVNGVDSILAIIDKYLLNDMETSTYNYNDHIEIRVTK